MILYKYRQDGPYTEKLITDQKVWLSNAAGLNDPFECKITEIAKDWIEKQVEIGMQGHITGLVMEAERAKREGRFLFGLSPREIKGVIKKIGKAKGLNGQYKRFREFIKSRTGSYPSDPRSPFKNFDKQLENVGIFSLSENPTNQLMWAHYAAESKGLAFGFEVAQGSKLADKEHCIPVSYSDELPAFEGDGFIAEMEMCITASGPVTTQKIGFSDPTFKKAVSTKPSCWSYEEEWRYIEEGCGLYPYPGPLVEIVFGLRCPDDVMEKYIELSRDHIGEGITYKKIENPKNSNRMEVVDLQMSF